MEKQYDITETSMQVFLMYAKDAGNWGGNPYIGYNVGGGKEERGNITQLKKAGLIRTQEDEAGNPYIEFTDAGKALAAERGITV